MIGELAHLDGHDDDQTYQAVTDGQISADNRTVPDIDIDTMERVAAGLRRLNVEAAR
ncbi:hypothetical protein [Nocardia australiensis]|uniref:hypothetical protein n=1 Tax=Nocardia australiensis TaxID=2887191 RepID=UPI001D15CF8B|nr:hypothetical protein [Nocardia australiensis]